MSSEETPDVPTASSTREAVREKAQQVQAKQARARVLRRTLLGLVVVAVLGAIGYGVYAAIDTTTEETTRYPTGLSADGIMVTSVTGLATEAEPELVEASPSPTPSPTPTTAGEDAEAAELTLAEGAVDIHIYVDYLSPGRASSSVPTPVSSPVGSPRARSRSPTTRSRC
ncbi:hypothetical protein [Microbacterium sp. NIBRBAC000506063]|uniref:hypothetical protein n=1 Tax=Microbacterium sp. NIBRBAC000506063 TaxID=2734618 RepID=UPI002948BF5B|nr:hypothetical protein [Microbacterium sp. NIBRBAC000506063]